MQGWWLASYAVLWILVIALAIIVVALARQIGTLHLRLGPRGALEIDDEGPPLGTTLPPVETTDIDGNRLTLGGPGEAQLLLFVSPGCMVCEQVLPSVPVVAQMGKLKPYVLTDVDDVETSLVYADKRLRAPLVSAMSFLSNYDVPGTPYVVVTDDDGVVRAKGTVNNLEQMEGLVDSARRRASGRTTQSHV